MGWQTPYIIIRVNEAGAVAVINTSEKIKDARYYLQYIAQPGDAIFTTPSHPKYAGAGAPSYSAHLKQRGVIEHDEKSWMELLKGAAAKLVFPAV